MVEAVKYSEERSGRKVNRNMIGPFAFIKGTAKNATTPSEGEYMKCSLSE